MKYPSCLYLEATQLNFCFKRPSLSSFWGDAIIQVQHQPSDQTTAPSETHINQHKKRPNKGFPPQPITILASSKIYKKLCSNGLDLAELEPTPVDHRQIRIGPAAHSREYSFQARATLTISSASREAIVRLLDLNRLNKH